MFPLSIKTRAIATIATVVAIAMSAVAPVAAQQVTGVLGQPSATTTIPGNQLPPPPKFGGVIKESALDSKPWWPPRVVPPKGAPNVLLIMTDDQGYGVSGTFGGVIPTPALDRVAKAGLRYTQFNSTALCSPTRAALITGRNHHSAGFGVISELSTGFPGYDSIIGPDNATIGGPGIAKGGTGVFKVDGRVLATEKLEHTIPFLLPPDETFDVGVDTRTPVDSSYEIPFRFNGKIDRVAFRLGPTQLSADDQKKVTEAIPRARD